MEFDELVKSLGINWRQWRENGRVGMEHPYTIRACSRMILGA